MGKQGKAGEMPNDGGRDAQPQDDSENTGTVIAELRAENERLRADLAAANSESAGRRHENNDLQQQINAMQATMQEINASLTAERDARQQAEQQAQQVAAQAERQSMISEIAQRHKLPAVVAARLQGATAEELEADAAAIAAELGNTGNQGGQGAGAGGSVGNSSWEGGLTLEQIEQMTTDQIRDRMDEVDAALKAAS